jgi:hypothetical protein
MSVSLSKIEDFGELQRFQRRFAKIPTGHAFRANDGDIRPLSEQEAATALSEGTAAIRRGAQTLKYSSWVILLLAVLGVFFQNGGGRGVFSSMWIVGFWTPVLHVMSWLYFQWEVRRVPEEWSNQSAERSRRSTSALPLRHSVSFC